MHETADPNWCMVPMMYAYKLHVAWGLSHQWARTGLGDCILFRFRLYNNKALLVHYFMIWGIPMYYP